MNTTRLLATLVAAAAAGGLAYAASAPLEAFQSAVEKTGCDAIPYESLRGTCKARSQDVNEWCKTKEWDCKELDPVALRQQIENVTRKVADLRRERERLESARSSAPEDKR